MLAGVPNASTLVCGEHYSAAVDADGTLYTWGRGDSEHLGYPLELAADGATAQRSPRAVPLLRNAVAGVALGWDHMLARTLDGRLFAWGANSFGQLGLGDLDDREHPTQVPGVDEVSAVACGWNFSACVTADGALLTWGTAGQGQLGHGNKARRKAPRPVAALAREAVVDVACGETHALAVTADGALYAWGCGDNGRLGLGDEDPRFEPAPVGGLPRSVRRAFAGDEHSAALTAEGELFVWGAGRDGRLGLGDEEDQLQPTPLRALPAPVAHAALGSRHTAAVAGADEAVYVWGSPANGRLGVDSPRAQLVPLPLPSRLLRGLAFAAVAAGASHSGAVAADGSVVMWGAEGMATDWGALGGAVALEESDDELEFGEEEAEDGDDGVATTAEAAHAPPVEAVDEGFEADASDDFLDQAPVPGLPAPPAPPADDDEEEDPQETIRRLRLENRLARALALLDRSRVQRSARAFGRWARAAARLAALAPDAEAVILHDQEAKRADAEREVLANTIGSLQERLARQALAQGVERVRNAVTRYAVSGLQRGFARWRMAAAEERFADELAAAAEPSAADVAARAQTDTRTMRRALRRMANSRLSAAFRKWRVLLAEARAEERAMEAVAGVEEALHASEEQRRQMRERLRYNRSAANTQLHRTAMCYGRDKLLAVWRQRTRWNTRSAFERWRLRASMARREEQVRRGQLRLQVGMEQVRAERDRARDTEQALQRTRLSVVVQAAFYKWRLGAEQRRRAEDVAAVRAEREFLLAELVRLYEHMQQVREGERMFYDTARAKGRSVMEGLAHLESALGGGGRR